MANNQANSAQPSNYLMPLRSTKQDIKQRTVAHAGTRDRGLWSSFSDPSSVLRALNSRKERLCFIVPAWEKGGTGLIWHDEWGPTGWVDPRIKELDPAIKLPSLHVHATVWVCLWIAAESKSYHSDSHGAGLAFRLQSRAAKWKSG